jgi:formylmethanofuran dehydrogenase subunit C
MIMVAIRKPIDLDGGNTSMAARRRFGNYKDESQKATREAEVEDTALKRILSFWKQKDLMDGVCDERNYETLANAIRGIEYTSEDIHKFCIALTDLQDEKDFGMKAGYFLSALINEGQDTEYEINVEHLAGQIDFFGKNNRKIVTVTGDLGKYTGQSMQEGSLTVKGNVENDAGSFMDGGELRVEGSADGSLGDMMSGGRIIVKESCGTDVGEKMQGGEIIIEGDAYGNVGNEMEGGSITIMGNMIKEKVRKMGVYTLFGTVGNEMQGGEIHLNGRYFLRKTCIKGGKIYHKGKLIVDK